MDSKARLMSIKQAAIYSGINVHSLKLYVSKGEIASVKIHKRRYIMRDDIEAYIQSCRVGGKVITLVRRGEH